MGLLGNANGHSYITSNTEITNTIELDPSDATVHHYWGKRMYPQVIEEWKAYGQLSGEDRNYSGFGSALEQGFRTKGWKGALAKGIEDRRAQRTTGYQSAYELAQLYAELGDKDQSFRWLQTAYEERDQQLINLQTDFLLDPIRSDPRFAELERRWGCRSGGLPNRAITCNERGT